MPRVLIADDNERVRSVLTKSLEERGIETIEAVDGEDALLKCESHKPDLIILDLSMPRMNGLEVARALKRKLRNARIIMFTFYATALQRADLVGTGINALVSKSDLTGLMDRVQALLSV